MATSTSSVPPTSFTLNRSLFNETLYSHLRDFWFAGLPPNASTANDETAKRWFGRGVSEDDKAAFDGQCRANFGPALESISPTHLELPPFKSYADELKQAEEISAPFLQEVKNANQENGQKGTETLLSLVLLLDQMPRNIHRDNAGLRLVYSHYDRLAWSLIRSSMKLQPNPTTHESYALRPVYLSWFILPLMHAEDLDSHDVADQYLMSVKARLEKAGATEAMEYLKASTGAQKSHRDVLDQFGRYPHRNECLGRESKAEETKYLETADTFGVKQSSKKEGKEEL